MNHIVIKQDTSGTEEVSSAVITALYNAVNDEYLDNNSELQGRLHSSYGGRQVIEYLTTTFQNLYISVDNYTIEFEDSEAERICVTNWGDGSIITDSQMAQVTNTGNVFKNNTDIIKFNEFRYFTNVNSYSFEGCTNLREITLPIAKTSIYEYAFKGCTSLQSFDFQNILSVGKYAFQNCNNTQFSNLGNIMSFGDNSFSNCSTLTSIEFPDGVFLDYNAFDGCGLQSVTFKGDFTASAYGRCFNWCNNLTSVTFETQFSYLPMGMFNHCSGLQTIDLTNCMSYRVSDNDPYYGGHFSECGSLITVTLSPHVNRLEAGMFGYSSIQRITIPANVTEIGNSCFYACRNLTVTCLPTTPPTLVKDANQNYNHFGMVPSIKVPAASLEAYKTAEGWSTWAGNITAIAS